MLCARDFYDALISRTNNPNVLVILLIFQTLTSKLFKSSSQTLKNAKKRRHLLTTTCTMLKYSLSTTEEAVYSLANKITALVKKKTLVEFLQLDSANSNLVISSSSLF